MIIEKTTQVDDLYLYEILRNPVLCGEFINNYDKAPDDEPFEFTWYQKDWLCDFNHYVSICCSRAVGKTVFIVNLYIWLLIFQTFSGDFDNYIVYGVPEKKHLETVWTGLVRSFRTNSFLKKFIATNSGINNSEHRLVLLSNATLLCRLAGQSGTGESFVSLHEPVISFDESGYFPWSAFTEAQQTLNTNTPGFKMIVSGVPDGRREKSVCFSCDQETGFYSKHRINSLQNPRFSEEDRQKVIEQYGGEDSEDYLHLVLGQHGKPVFSLFDRELMLLSQDPVYKLEIDGIKLQDSLTEYLNRLSTFPGLPDRNAHVIIGIDLGYTEPTAIVVLYLDRNKVLHFHGRIKLTKVPYPIQEKIIDYLDSKFDPVIIGVDKGNTGISTIQHLLQDNIYYSKNYAERIVPVDFSGWITIGKDENDEDIKVEMKPFSVQILQDFSNNHKIAYSNKDPEMFSELERMTYSKSVSGKISYKTLTIRGGQKGEDHFTAALLCGVTAYYLTEEFIMNKVDRPKLLRPTWIPS